MERSEYDDLLRAVCEAIDPNWNKGSAIVERTLLDQAERVLSLIRERLTRADVVETAQRRLVHYGPLDARPFMYSNFESPAHAVLSAVLDLFAKVPAGGQS